MSATAATAKKQKPLKRHPSKLKQASAYTILTLILISIVAVTFAFPLYWIITGSFKTGAAINSTTPEWWPHEWVLTNYQKLFAGKSAPLWQLAIPFSARFSADGDPIYFSVGPTAPAALRWMINTVFMAVVSMILTCITAAMAGYALAKKRFVGRQLLFTGAPLVPLQVHPVCLHGDAVGPQQLPLEPRHGKGPGTGEIPLAVHHPEGRRRGPLVEAPPHLPGPSGSTAQRRDLPVGGHLPGRDGPTHQRHSSRPVHSRSSLPFSSKIAILRKDGALVPRQRAKPLSASVSTKPEAFP